MSYSTASHACVLLTGSPKAVCHRMCEVWIYWAVNDTLVCLSEKINQLTKQRISELRIKTRADPWTELRSIAGTKLEYIKRILLLPCYPRNTTTNSCFLLNFSSIQKTVCQCKIMMFQDTRSYLLRSAALHQQKPTVALGHPVGRNIVTIFPAVKLAWFPNHNLTDLREAKANKLLRHRDT